MATSSVNPISNMRSYDEYLRFGRGDKKKLLKALGHDRVLRSTFDASSRSRFVKMCRDYCNMNSRRSREVYEIRVSWSPEEFKHDSEEDWDRALEFGYELAHRCYPDSPCMVVVHNDGVGGCVHAHVEVLNHDFDTGRAISEKTLHAYVKKHSDQLCREWGLDVVGERTNDWLVKRENLKEDSFERKLGDAVYDARNRAHDYESFYKNLEANGVEVIKLYKVADKGREGATEKDILAGKYTPVKDDDGNDVLYGFNFKMSSSGTVSYDGKSPRKGSNRKWQRTGSSLSQEFTIAELDSFFEVQQREYEEERERMLEENPNYEIEQAYENYSVRLTTEMVREDLENLAVVFRRRSVRNLVPLRNSEIDKLALQLDNIDDALANRCLEKLVEMSGVSRYRLFDEVDKPDVAEQQVQPKRDLKYISFIRGSELSHAVELFEDEGELIVPLLATYELEYARRNIEEPDVEHKRPERHQEGEAGFALSFIAGIYHDMFSNEDEDEQDKVTDITDITFDESKPDVFDDFESLDVYSKSPRSAYVFDAKERRVRSASSAEGIESSFLSVFEQIAKNCEQVSEMTDTERGDYRVEYNADWYVRDVDGIVRDNAGLD